MQFSETEDWGAAVPRQELNRGEKQLGLDLTMGRIFCFSVATAMALSVRFHDGRFVDIPVTSIIFLFLQQHTRVSLIITATTGFVLSSYFSHLAWVHRRLFNLLYSSGSPRMQPLIEA